MPSKTIYDVFQPGLRRGSEHLPHDPIKAYAYVEHPTEGWRVYLRSAVFLHPRGAPANCKNFLVVKRTGAPYHAATWEPPKGQMEGKDIRHNQPIKALLEENVRRETEEEAHITDLIGLKHTGLAFQGQEKTYPPNWFFQYHIFRAEITPEAAQASQAWFRWAADHPKAFARMRRDRREKDAVAFYSPRATPLNPRWCPQIAALYFKSACGAKRTTHKYHGGMISNNHNLQRDCSTWPAQIAAVKKLIIHDKKKLLELPIGEEYYTLYETIKEHMRLVDDSKSSYERLCSKRRNSTRKLRGGGISNIIKRPRECKKFYNLLIEYKKLIEIQYKNMLSAPTVKKHNEIYAEIIESIKEFENIKYILESECHKTIPPGYDFYNIKNAINAEHTRDEL